MLINNNSKSSLTSVVKNNVKPRASCFDLQRLAIRSLSSSSSSGIPPDLRSPLPKSLLETALTQDKVKYNIKIPPLLAIPYLKRPAWTCSLAKYSTLSTSACHMRKSLLQTNKILASIAGKDRLSLDQKRVHRKPVPKEGTVRGKGSSTQLLFPELNYSTKSVMGKFDGAISPVVGRTKPVSTANIPLMFSPKNKRSSDLLRKSLLASGNKIDLCFSPSKQSSSYLDSSPGKSNISKRDMDNLQFSTKLNLEPIELENSSISSSQEASPVRNSDWYFQAKLKFIAKRIFCHKFDPEEDYSVQALEKGVCGNDKCK